MKLTGKVLLKVMPLLIIFTIFFTLGLYVLRGGKTYRVTVEPGIETARDTYKAGEEVTVRTHNVMDEITEIYVDGTKAVRSGESDDEWVVVKFTMPAHDVSVTSRSVNISEDPGQKSDTVLITYLSMVTGTEMPQPYEKYLLIRDPSGDLFVDHEHHEDGEVTVTRYSVDAGAYDKMMKFITEEAGMDRWSEIDNCEPLDGGYSECVFLYEGSYIKVSTEDNMPQDGLRYIGSVGKMFYEYIGSGRKVS